MAPNLKAACRAICTSKRVGRTRRRHHADAGHRAESRYDLIRLGESSELLVGSFDLLVQALQQHE